MGSIGSIIGWLVIGLIAGALAKLIMPGKDPGGIIVTLLLGIVGAILGGWLGGLIFGQPLQGFSFVSLILAIVGVATVVTVIDINRVEAGADVVNVKVTGHQWWWEYEYPDLGVVTANELHIPTGTRVELQMTSDDVIHSFWPPKLAGKVDVIPGHTNTMALHTDEAGEFEGQCAEFCGLSHSRMRLRVIAESPEDFDAWVTDQKRAQTAPAPGGVGEIAEGAALFQSRGCGGCHTVEGYTQGLIGPNLTHLYDRETFAGAIFDLNSRNLRRWLRNPQAEKAGNKMVLPIELNEDEITKLIAYLETLK